MTDKKAMSELRVSNFIHNNLPKRLSNVDVFDAGSQGQKLQKTSSDQNMEAFQGSMTPKMNTYGIVDQRKISAVSMDKIQPANYLNDKKGGSI